MNFVEAMTAAQAVCDAFDAVSLSEAYGGSGATSVASRDLNTLKKAVKALRESLASPPPVAEGEAQPVALLRELVNRTENFWALVQGEYGVRLSDDDDHNVVGFFSALEDANKFLTAALSSVPGKESPAPAEEATERRCLLWVYDLLSVDGGMTAKEQTVAFEEIGKVLRGEPARSDAWMPNEWDDSFKYWLAPAPAVGEAVADDMLPATDASQRTAYDTIGKEKP